MTSLRARLLVWLTVLHLLAAVAIAAITYGTSRYLNHTFMDDQMRALADSYLQARQPRVPPLPEGDAGVHDWGTLLIQVWSPGAALAQASLDRVPVPLQGAPGFHDVRAAGQAWRVYTARTPERAVQVIQSAAFRAADVRNRALMAAFGVLALIPLAGLAAWLAVRLAMAPLDAVRAGAEALSGQAPAPLATDGVPDEVRPLVDAINALLRRIEGAFGQQQRFIQDAAHELRTPITGLSLQASELVSAAQGTPLADRARQLQAAALRLARLTAQLLSLARLDSVDAGAAAPAALMQVIEAVATELLPLADARRIELALDVLSAPQRQVNAEAARALLSNLLDNALRYAPPGSRVTVRVEGEPAPRIAVLDEGPGIADVDLPHVFDRFYRAPGAPSGGSGLGLSIARQAAQQLGATLTLARRPQRAGLMAEAVFGPLPPTAH